MNIFNRVFHMLPGVHYHQGHQRAEWSRMHPHHPFPGRRPIAPYSAPSTPPAAGLHWVPLTGWVDAYGRPGGHPVAVTGGIAPPGGAPPAPPTGGVAPPVDGMTPDMGSEFGGHGGGGSHGGGRSSFLLGEGYGDPGPDDFGADSFGHGGGGGGGHGGGGGGFRGGGWGGGGWGWGYPYGYPDYDEEVIYPAAVATEEGPAPVVIVRRGSPWGMRG